MIHHDLCDKLSKNINGYIVLVLQPLGPPAIVLWTRARGFCAAEPLLPQLNLGPKSVRTCGQNGKNLPEVVHSKIIQNSEQGWLATGCYSQNISQYGVVIHPHVTSPGFFVIQGLWWIIATVLQYLNVLNTHLHMHQKWWTQNFGRFQIPEIWHLGKAVFPAPSTRQLRSSGPVQVKVPASSLSGHRLLCSWVWHLKISGIPIEFKKIPWLILIFSSNRIFWGIPRFRRWKWWESSGQTDGCCQMKSSSKCFLNRDAGHTTNSHAFVSQVSTGV